MTALVDQRPSPDHPSTRPPARATRPRTVVAVAAWIALVFGVRFWGLAVVHHSRADLYVGAVPFFGRWSASLTARTVVPMAVGAAGVVLLPWVMRGAPWRTLLAIAAVGAVAFGAALSFAKPPDTAWLSIHDDYGQHIDLVDNSPGAFLRDYVGHQATYPTHLQAHPPGMVLLLSAASSIGLQGERFENGLALLGAAAAVTATLVLVEAVAGTRTARQTAPFLVLAPAAVWHTNADTVYAGVALTGITLMSLAVWRGGTRSAGYALAGGVVFGAALLLSYGVLVLAVVPVVLAGARRRPGPLLVAAGACVATLALPACWGFSWPAGLQATKHQYDLNLARVRPYGYFVVANLAVFAVAVGPATAVGLARLRDAHTWLVVGAGLLVVAIADASGLALAETERIWQPFMPLVLVAGAGLTTSGRIAPRRWLAAQVALAVGLVVALRSPW